ncbi:MAG: helix-turn-helix transcriptional regulator [Pirellulales bacterium]|nr:helix-turn-helix transcriptional regulator [Pirellulales bacterium]
MGKTLSQQIASTDEGRRLLGQEGAILELTELICEIMEEEEISRSQLAERLRRTRGYVTQLLDGRANMTIRTIADVFDALGTTIHFHDEYGRGQFATPPIQWILRSPISSEAADNDIEPCDLAMAT